ncbi:MAG: 16S rRNA (cytidine(1402)-2'-O)-methyltransferase [Duodenibacillus sp.]|nr:16S rRNA (cytidine(1402)-2'-O)-methyltransferase [Duodenibacillus sp.]
MSSPPVRQERWDASQEPLFERALLHEQSFPSPALYIVGMPIGNAADITLRALWVLAKADAIACEDTRETRKVLDRYGIRSQLLSVHEHNERQAAETLIDRLAAGQRIALVTDAGTPAVSDPGARAVQSVRAAGYRVIPVPGPSAVVAALSAAGLSAYGFTFAGFMPPQSSARAKALAELAGRKTAFALYESPHRIRDLLEELGKQLGAGRRVVLAREVTKKFEEFSELRSEDLASFVTTMQPKGEYAILVDEGADDAPAGLSDSDLKWIQSLEKLLPASKLAAAAAKATGASKDAIYRMLVSQKSHG